MTERIFGPIRGHYVAAWACPTGAAADEFVPFARIFAARPDSFWGGEPLCEVIGDRRRSGPSDALGAGLELAIGELKRISPVRRRQQPWPATVPAPLADMRGPGRWPATMPASLAL